MDQFKELRAHPKMTKTLLEQIENLQKQNHTTDEISATLGITPEAVERGYEKLNDKRRTEIRAKRGGAFAVKMEERKARVVCTEINCPWRGNNREYCVWPSCFKSSISTVHPEEDEGENEAETDTMPMEEESVNA